MKIIFTLLLITLLHVFVSAIPPDGKGYVLVWSDEFEDTILDTTSWTAVTDNRDYLSNLHAHYTGISNLSFNNENAIIELRKESSDLYTSSQIETRNKKQFKYGYIEARIKAPEGLLSKLWTLGSDVDSVGWPICGQIDVFLIQCSNYRAACDYKNYGLTSYINESSGMVEYFVDSVENQEKLSADFHIYAIEWDENWINWYFDDSLYASFDITASYLSEFHKPHFLILDVDISDRVDSLLPQAMYIDYVRVYQKTTHVRESKHNNLFNKMVLKNPEGAYLKVYNMQGRLIADLSSTFRSIKRGEQFSIKTAVSALPQGVYLARIYNGMNVISGKIVVQK